MASSSNTILVKQKFEKKLLELLQNKRLDNSFFITNERYETLINHVKESKVKRKKETSDYRCLTRYDVLIVGDEEKLIKPLVTVNSTVQYYLRTTELFDILNDTHVSIGHGGRNRMANELRMCQKKKSASKMEIVTQPVTSNQLNSRAQIDLIDMQFHPYKNFKFILVYQDYLTKFVILKTLKTKNANEIAHHLLDIFTTLGAPVILQSGSGREFSKSVVNQLSVLWKDVKLVHGNPNHLQSDGSTERVDCKIKDMLLTWMADNLNDNWEAGIKFVQFTRNRAYHKSIKKSPYEALFGRKARAALASTSLLGAIEQDKEAEEEVEKFISVGVGENIDDKLEGVIEEMKTELNYCCVCSEIAETYTCIMCEAFVHHTCGISKEEDGVIKITCKWCFRGSSIKIEEDSLNEEISA